MTRHRWPTRTLSALLVTLTITTGCGVNSQDDPETIDDSSIREHPATPTVDTDPRPTPTTTTESPRNRPLTDPPAPSVHEGSLSDGALRFPNVVQGVAGVAGAVEERPSPRRPGCRRP